MHSARITAALQPRTCPAELRTRLGSHSRLADNNAVLDLGSTLSEYGPSRLVLAVLKRGHQVGSHCQPSLAGLAIAQILKPKAGTMRSSDSLCLISVARARAKQYTIHLKLSKSTMPHSWRQPRIDIGGCRCSISTLPVLQIPGGASLADGPGWAPHKCSRNCKVIAWTHD